MKQFKYYLVRAFNKQTSETVVSYNVTTGKKASHLYGVLNRTYSEDSNIQPQILSRYAKSEAEYKSLPFIY